MQNYIGIDSCYGLISPQARIEDGALIAERIEEEDENRLRTLDGHPCSLFAVMQFWPQ